MIGNYTLTDQGLEDHAGNPIDVDTDIFGNIRDLINPTADPFENIETGPNTFIFKIKKCHSERSEES